MRVRQRDTASTSATATATSAQTPGHRRHRNLGTDTRPHTEASWSVVPARHSRPGTVTASQSPVVSVCAPSVQVPVVSGCAPRYRCRCPCLAVSLCLLWLPPRAGDRLLILLETIRNNGQQSQNISLLDPILHRRGPEKLRKKLRIISKCAKNVQKMCKKCR